MPPKRGTRPTGPRPWPSAALAAREEAVALAEEIVKLARRAKVAPQANIYLTRQLLAEIEAHAERQQHVLGVALRGGTPDPALASLGEMIADLIGDVAGLRRRVAELEAKSTQLCTVPRQVEG